MKTLRDTIDGMMSDDWKERLVAEIEQCDLRMYGLEKHLKKIGEDSPEYSLLQEQYDAMGKYLSILIARATTFDIKYNLPSFENRIEETRIPDAFKSDSRDMLWLFILLYLMGGGND